MIYRGGEGCQKIYDKKMIFFGDKEDIYIFIISISIELKKYKIAFEILEKAKSRYFLEMLYRKNINSKNSVEYEKLIYRVEITDNIEEIFKLRKELEKKISNIKVINTIQLTFEDVKNYL